MDFLVCTDSAPVACPHSCLLERASQEISVGADVVWSESPYTGCVSSLFVQAWWYLHRSMASGASGGQSQDVHKSNSLSLTLKLYTVSKT